MNPSCPSISVIPTATNLKSADSNVLFLLSLIIFLCHGFYSIATEIFQAHFTAVSVKSAPVAVLNSQLKYSLSKLIDSDLELNDSDDLMEEIELELLPILNCPLNSGSEDDCEAQSPKLMAIKPLLFEEPKSSDNEDLNPIEDEENVRAPCINEPQENQFLQEEQDKLTIQIVKQIEVNSLCDKKPFEYYLKWNIPIEELEQLTYSEKARRFYHLTTYGEVQEIKEEPPEEQQVEPDTFIEFEEFEEDTIESFENQQQEFFEPNYENELDAHDLQECGVVQLYQEPQKPHWIPMNLLSDLVDQADRIDIHQFQMDLLKMNCIFNCAFLADQKCQFIKSQLRIIDPMAALTQRSVINSYIKPQLKLLYNYEDIEESNTDDLVLNNMNVAFSVMKNFIIQPKAFQTFH